MAETCEKWIASVAEHDSGRARRMEGHLSKIRNLMRGL